MQAYDLSHETSHKTNNILKLSCAFTSPYSLVLPIVPQKASTSSLWTHFKAQPKEQKLSPQIQKIYAINYKEIGME